MARACWWARRLGVNNSQACGERRRARGDDGAAESGRHAVAAGAEDPAVMPSDQPGDDLTLVAEGLKRGLFVRVHEARIPLDIGGEDRG